MQRFKFVTKKRSEINLADYNPRIISKSAQEKLKKSIKKYGLVQPIIVNKRTGNVVGGNQRLTILDELNKKNDDYEITVAEIDVSEEEEKKLNIILNNESLMGEYDGDLLKDLLQEIKVDPINDLFFDKVDIDFMLGIDYLTEGEKKIKKDVEEVNKRVQKLKELRKKHRQQYLKENETKGNPYEDVGYNDYTVMIVFNNNKSKKAFLKAIKEEKSRFISENKIYDIIQEKYRWR